MASVPNLPWPFSKQTMYLEPKMVQKEYVQRSWSAWVSSYKTFEECRYLIYIYTHYIIVFYLLSIFFVYLFIYVSLSFVFFPFMLYWWVIQNVHSCSLLPTVHSCSYLVIYCICFVAFINLYYVRAHKFVYIVKTNTFAHTHTYLYSHFCVYLEHVYVCSRMFWVLCKYYRRYANVELDRSMDMFTNTVYINKKDKHVYNCISIYMQILFIYVIWRYENKYELILLRTTSRPTFSLVPLQLGEHLRYLPGKRTDGCSICSSKIDIFNRKIIYKWLKPAYGFQQPCSLLGNHLSPSLFGWFSCLISHPNGLGLHSLAIHTQRRPAGPNAQHPCLAPEMTNALGAVLQTFSLECGPPFFASFCTCYQPEIWSASVELAFPAHHPADGSEFLDLLYFANLFFILWGWGFLLYCLARRFLHVQLALFLLFRRLSFVEGQNAFIAQASSRIDAITTTFLILSMSPAILLFMPGTHVPFFELNIDLFPHVSPTCTIGCKKNLTNFADPTEWRLSLACCK